MATQAEAKQQEFFTKVRKRTANQWRKAYITGPEKEEKDAEKLLNRLRSKPESAYSIHSVIWLLISIGVFYLVDFAGVVLYDHRVDRLWLKAGVISMVVAACCFVYCIIWLSLIRKVKSDRWEEYNPYVIPVATVALVVGFILLCGALWPVWRFLTFPIVILQVYGFVIMIAMIPDGIGL